jgi:hypothetical protein
VRNIRSCLLAPGLQELSISIAEAKSQAAAACEGLTLEELGELATAMTALPEQQLEAAVMLIASRQPTMLHPHEVGGWCAVITSGFEWCIALAACVHTVDGHCRPSFDSRECHLCMHLCARP